METYIKVHAKAQNRTALGIMHAYLAINPNCTLADMKAAFPWPLNTNIESQYIFKTLAEIVKQMQRVDWNGYFTDNECLLKFKDGTKAAVNQMWTGENLDKLVKCAKEYGIAVEDAEGIDKSLYKKTGYYLEYLRPFKLEKMDFGKWPDTRLYNEIRQKLTADTGGLDFEFIHFIFKREDAKTAVYADGVKVYCADGDDCTGIMALGVLKGYVEQMNELLFNVKPSVAPEADKANVITFIEDYAEKMAPHIIATDLHVKTCNRVYSLYNEVKGWWAEDCQYDLCEQFHDSSDLLQGIYSWEKDLNLPDSFNSGILGRDGVIGTIQRWKRSIKDREKRESDYWNEEGWERAWEFDEKEERERAKKYMAKHIEAHKLEL